MSTLLLPPDGATGSRGGVSANRARLAALIGDRRRTIVSLAFISILAGFCEAGILALLAQIATTAAKGGSHVQSRLGVFHIHAPATTLFAIAFGLTLARVALQIPLAVLPSRIAADVQAKLRNELFRAFSRASWAMQASEREGHLQETMTSQVMQASMGALMATQIVVGFFAFLVLMGSALALNVIAAGAILVSALALFGVLRPLNVLGQRTSSELSRAQLSYAGGVNEASRLAEETQVFGVAHAQRERVGRLIKTARDLFYRTQLIVRLTPAIYQSGVYIILVGGLYVVYEQGNVQHFASLGAVVLLIVRAGAYGQIVQGAYQNLRQALPFIERLQDTARRYESSAPVDGGQPLRSVESLAFAGVSYAYHSERPVLKHVSFEVPAGEAVGVVGPSGAGKSTLIQILLQLRAPDAGHYLVNGVPAAEFARGEWHRLVAYVPQQPRLLHASVADNIRYFRDIDEESVERAARLARIHDDVMSWEQGYETIVGPRMDAVSGGQQQRICLARALAARPQVLVLDEPTSALDPHSETLIQESLSSLRHELTLFIVAHRMSTLDICDRVMVILDGALAAFDTTERLAQSNQYYRSASTLALGAAGGRLS